MEVIATPIPGLLVLQPKVFEDQRGYFFESFNQNDCREIGIDPEFVQDNQSMSQKGVLRGLHFQNPPFAQGKLVRVVTGAVLDVAVDIRKSSKTYGQHFAAELNAKTHAMLWIPAGFAHGFLTLEDNTVFSYKCTEYYHRESEDGIMWNDADLAIDWGIGHPIISEKDRNNKHFRDFESKFS